FHEPTERSLLRSCRSNPTRNRRAPGPRRGIGVRLGEPLLPDTTHDLVALEGAGVRGADFASQSGAVADLQACAGATEVGHRLAGAGAGDFRRKLQATRRAVD